MLRTKFLVLLIHHLATESKSSPKWIPKMFEIALQGPDNNVFKFRTENTGYVKKRHFFLEEM
jgi:hypothetical protein